MPDDPKPPGEGPEPEAYAEGLAPEHLEALLALLDPDRERAGEIYEEIRGRLIRIFEWRHCDCPEDLADETFNRVGRRRAERAPIEDPLAYIYGVANRVFKEFWRREERKRRAREAERPADPIWPDPREDERLDCVRRCLADLPEDQRSLIVRYHDDDDRIHSRRELARELGIAMNALRIRAHRIRRDLEECVRSCLATQR
jgi:DNA-directed RNA polymerase specialized sigma24 family protein